MKEHTSSAFPRHPQATPPHVSPPEGAPEREPQGDIFIDRGAPLPEGYPGPRLRALVRDPGNLHVYWQVVPPAGAIAWQLEASSHEVDASRESRRVELDADRARIAIPTLAGGLVSLRPVFDDAVGAALLTVNFGPLPEQANVERWLEITDASFATGDPPRVVDAPEIGAVESVEEPALAGYDDPER